jgi:hypothetical protein
MDDQESDRRELARSSNAMNTKDKDAWYHCGHCGSLFQSDYGYDDERVCDTCQSRPGVGLWAVVSSASPVASAKVASFHKTGEKVRTITRAALPKRRRLKGLIWFTLIWVFVLLGVIGFRHFLMNAPSKSRVLSVVDLDKGLAPSDRIKILNQVLPECDRVIRGFLSTTVLEERSGYIANAMDIKSKMDIYYKDNKFPSLDVDSLQRTSQEWVRLGQEWMVLTHWKDAIGENEFDVVFKKESDGWKLDWLHFSQYSETSWRLFLAGEGQLDQAEFRLLARHQKNAETSRLGEQRMLIVLAAPVWGQPNQIVSESPVILIDLMSHDGQLLSAAFDLKGKNPVDGDAEFAPLETGSFVQVRVIVSRDDLGGKYRLTINELKACHWLDSDISSV